MISAKPVKMAGNGSELRANLEISTKHHLGAAYEKRDITAFPEARTF